MSAWDDLLPKSLMVGERDYSIRSDYRAVLDACSAMADPDLSDQERQFVLLDILYEGFDEMPIADYKEAVEKALWFVNGGEDPDDGKAPKLVDWEQDFKLIVAPVNRVVGTEIRAIPYLHWWTFLSAYYEIGDCLFAQVVRIREKKAKGKKLDKQDQEWYRKNRKIVDLKQSYSEAENDLLKAWMGGNRG